MRTIKGVCRLAGLVAFILFVFLFVLICFPFMNWKLRGRWIRFWAARLPRVLGMTVSVSGDVPRETSRLYGRAPGETGYLVVANHISFVDVFALDAVLPCQFVAKSEIARWPVFGSICRHAGTLFIDRGSRRSIVEIVKLLSGSLKEGGNALFFPEGTVADGLALLPFHPNLFEAAVQTGADVLPVAVHYTVDGRLSDVASYAGHQSMWDVVKRIVFSEGVGVHVEVLAPIPSAGETRQSLSEKSSAAIAAAIGVPDATLEKKRELERRLAAGE